MIKALLSSLFLLAFASPVKAGPTVSYTAVYSGKTTELNVDNAPFAPLWGANASKSCSINGTLLFVGRTFVGPGAMVELFANSGSGWQVVWTSDIASKQNPLIVCDSKGKAHVLYNKYSDSSLVHFRFGDPYLSPEEINTSIAFGTISFDYMTATANRSGRSKVFIAAYDAKMPAGARTFNIYNFDGDVVKADGTTGQWYSRANAEIYQAYDYINNRYKNTRTDGDYLYPVIASDGHRVFAAAALFPIASLGDNHTLRKHWTFWDLAYYGQRRINHYHRDVAAGQNPSREDSLGNPYYVAPTAMKQAEDGTLYILSDIRGSSNTNQNGSYITTYINGRLKKTQIPGSSIAASMTAQNKMVIVVDGARIHWSCDRGENWDSQTHDVRNQVVDTRELHNLGNVFVKNTISNDGKVQAYFGLVFKDSSTSPIPQNPRSEITNMTIDVNGLCE